MPEGRRFPNPFRAALALVAACWAAAAPAGAAQSVPSGATAPVRWWGQAQSHLEALDDRPLIAANWYGRYRPYLVVDDAFVPLVADEPAVAADVDLMTPLPVTGDEVLLSGTAAGRPAWDLWLYDRKRALLTNLTATPTADEGNPCVAAGTRLVAYRAPGGERVARLRDGALVPLAHGALPAFDRCAWTDATTLVGIERRGRAYQLHRCSVTEESVACAPAAALADVDTVTAFFPAPPGLGLIARRRGDAFRAPLAASAPFDALVPAPLDPRPVGDVLDVDGGATRVGLHGRYTSSLVDDPTTTVYATRKIGGAWYAIVATDRMSRTLARVENGTWRVLRDASVRMPEHVARPVEVWMRSPRGDVHQAFYFGPQAPTQVVVWWHGGPAESISPRFNPYFHRLNELGFGVLAVNYPGSTGRGAAYEARFTASALADCVAAVWSYLRENGVETIVSWSVSSGITVQRAVLDARVPLSSVVDQSAWGRSTVLRDAEARAIPMFTIRGRHDPAGPTDHVDFWYPGGHDVTLAGDFVALFEAVTPFLARARPVASNAVRDEPNGVVLDARATDADAALAFELATHLRRACLADRPVVVVPTGVPSLGGAPAADERRTRAASERRARILVRGDAPAAAARALRPIDLADPSEAARVRDAGLASDGARVHPRLEAVATEHCDELRALLGADPGPR